MRGMTLLLLGVGWFNRGSLTLHCSGPNTTATRRRGWSIHYVSAQTRYIGTPEETEKVKKLDCLEGPEPINGWPLIRGRQFPGCV